MGFFSNIAQSFAGYGALTAAKQEECFRNPMQQAYDMALASCEEGKIPCLSDVQCCADSIGISSYDQSNLAGLKMSGLIIDQAGVDNSSSINISGVQAEKLICDPYTTYASLETSGLAAPEIGELVCVGYKDNAPVAMPPLENASIGKITCVAEDGGSPHNISLALKNCAVGAIDAQNGNYMQFSAENCWIDNANFENNRALALDVKGGRMGGSFDGCSFAPKSEGFVNTDFSGTVRNAIGQISCAQSNFTHPDVFTGTNVDNFDMAGAKVPENKQTVALDAAGMSDVERLMSCIEQAHGTLGRCGVTQTAGDVAKSDISEGIPLAHNNEINRMRQTDQQSPSLA